MEIFENAAVIWFIIGFVFFVLEFAIPGLILFFFAVGAWIVAFLSFFFNIPIEIQLVIFVAASVITILLFRKWVKKILWVKRNTSEIEDEFIGKTAIAETVIAPGQKGKVDFKGTLWDAKSNETILKGEYVTIIGNESILLIVTSNKTV